MINRKCRKGEHDWDETQEFDQYCKRKGCNAHRLLKGHITHRGQFVDEEWTVLEHIDIESKNDEQNV